MSVRLNPPAHAASKITVTDDYLYVAVKLDDTARAATAAHMLKTADNRVLCGIAFVNALPPELLDFLAAHIRHRTDPPPVPNMNLDLNDDPRDGGR